MHRAPSNDGCPFRSIHDGSTLRARFARVVRSLGDPPWLTSSRIGAACLYADWNDTMRWDNYYWMAIACRRLDDEDVALEGRFEVIVFTTPATVSRSQGTAE